MRAYEGRVDIYKPGMLRHACWDGPGQEQNAGKRSEIADPRRGGCSPGQQSQGSYWSCWRCVSCEATCQWDRHDEGSRLRQRVSCAVHEQRQPSSSRLRSSRQTIDPGQGPGVVDGVVVVPEAGTGARGRSRRLCQVRARPNVAGGSGEVAAGCGGGIVCKSLLWGMRTMQAERPRCCASARKSQRTGTQARPGAGEMRRVCVPWATPVG